MDTAMRGGRRAATWLALGAVPALAQVVIFLLTDERPRQFIVDTAELTDDVSMFTSVFSRMGIILWFCSATATFLTASALDRGHPLREPLHWIGGLSLLLGLDDGLVIHENLPSPLGLPDAVWLLPAGLVVVRIVTSHRDRLRPEADLAVVAALGFAVSVGVDLVLEGLLESYATGVLFVEENAKFAGIIAWFGFCLTVCRRGLAESRTDPPAAVSP